MKYLKMYEDYFTKLNINFSIKNQIHFDKNDIIRINDYFRKRFGYSNYHFEIGFGIRNNLKWIKIISDNILTSAGGEVDRVIPYILNKYLDRSSYITCLEFRILGGKSTFTGLRKVESSFNIYKSEDEWFYVNSNLANYGKFKCDQLDGLFKCLDTIYKK